MIFNLSCTTNILSNIYSHCTYKITFVTTYSLAATEVMKMHYKCDFMKIGKRNTVIWENSCTASASAAGNGSMVQSSTTDIMKHLFSPHLYD